MPTTETVRLSGPAALAASVPSLVGFQPAIGDAVLVTMGGRRVGMVARFEATRGALDDIARSLAATVKRQPDVTHAHVITYGPDRHLPHDVAGALWRAGVNCREMLRVHDGRVFEGYSDAAGIPLPEDVVRPAAILEAGAVLRASRAELEALFDGPCTPPADDTRGLSRIVADVALRDQRLGMLADMHGLDLAEEVDLAVRTVRCWPAGPIRDAALTYAALAAYMHGDGALANVALDRVTGPYSLARLIRTALAVGVPPAELRTMMRQAAGL